MDDQGPGPAIDPRLRDYLAAELRQAESDFQHLSRRAARRPARDRRPLGILVVAAVVIGAFFAIPRFAATPPFAGSGPTTGPDGLPMSIDGEPVLRISEIGARVGDGTPFLAGGTLVLRLTHCPVPSVATQGCSEEWQLAGDQAAASLDSFALDTLATAPPAEGGSLNEALVPDFVSAWARDGLTIAGYVPKGYLLSPGTLPGTPSNPPQSPPAPVYGEDLTTLVGYMVPGQGFVALGSPGPPAASSPSIVSAPSPVATGEASLAPTPEPTTVAPPTPSLAADEFALPTRPPNSTGGGDALLSGILGGTARDGGGCLWLEELAPNGSVAQRASIIWPSGFRAFVNPLRVVGPDGQLVATVGDTIQLGGGGQPLDYVPTPAQDPCGLGQVVSVSSVVSVNGR